MQYPTCPFMVLYNAYRIVRQVGDGATADADGDGDGDGDGHVGRALYFVQRPDGSECCRDMTWTRVERAIRRDMAATRWPPDTLPPGLAEALDTDGGTRRPRSAGAKSARARPRTAATPRR
jgi:hypothetical protein